MAGPLTRIDGRDERGAIVILVAGSLLVFMLLMVFVVDVSNWWTQKSHLQLQADAAALAGGDAMGECLINSDTSVANTDVQNQASAFSGTKAHHATNPTTGYSSGANSTKNTAEAQFSATNHGSLSMFYNSTAYPNGAAEDYAPPTVPGAPCTTQVLDVKASDQNLPLFFGAIAGFSAVPSINAHARVQLFGANSGKASLPLAVPDVNPSSVYVTLWNMSGSASPVTTALGDAGPDTLKVYQGIPLEKWQGTVALPAESDYSTIGVRVGMTIGGAAPASCYNTFGDFTAGYYCFDQSSKQMPLAVVRSYAGSASPAFHTPLLDGVSGTTCAGATNPFFSDLDGSSCAVGFTASVRWVACPAHTTCQFTVKLTTLNSTGTTITQTQSGPGTGTYTFNPGSYPLAFAQAPAEGQVPAQFAWSYRMTTDAGFTFSGGNCDGPPVARAGALPVSCSWPTSGTTTFPPASPPSAGGTQLLQGQVYSGDADPGVTGPIKVISVSPSSYDKGGGTATITVEIQGKFANLPVPSPVIPLRADFGGSRSSLVKCTPAGASGGNDIFQNTVQFGCVDIFQKKLSGTCPDTPPSPPDCIPVATGSHGGSLLKPINNRYTPCPANNWGGVIHDGDPRLLQLWITDYLALLGQKGDGWVPIRGLGYFYLTGWGYFKQGQAPDLGPCSSMNDPPPASIVAKSVDFVAVWGRYVKYVNPNDGTDFISQCVTTNPYACTVKLTQ